MDSSIHTLPLQNALMKSTEHILECIDFIQDVNPQSLDGLDYLYIVARRNIILLDNSGYKHEDLGLLRIKSLNIKQL